MLAGLFGSPLGFWLRDILMETPWWWGRGANLPHLICFSKAVCRRTSQPKQPAGSARVILFHCLELTHSLFFPNAPWFTYLPALLCSCYLDEVERELLRGLDQMMRQETWQPLTAELKVGKDGIFSPATAGGAAAPASARSCCCRRRYGCCMRRPACDGGRGICCASAHATAGQLQQHPSQHSPPCSLVLRF